MDKKFLVAAAFCIFGIFMFLTTCITFIFSTETLAFLVPIFEEFFKAFSIIISYIFSSCWIGIIYTGIFSVYEFIIYIGRYYYITPPEYILFRFVCILFHFSLFFFQYLGFVLYKKMDDVLAFVLFFAIACQVHLIWNLTWGRYVLEFCLGQ